MKKCFLISGLSGAGKTTIAQEIIKKNPKIEKIITSTTRSIRPNEKDKVDYYFYNRHEFDNMIKDGKFFEYAEVYGNLYGSEKKEVERIHNSNHIPLFVCDIQGIENLSKVIDNLIKIFIIPDSLGNLRKRIENRPGSKPEDVERRLEQVDEEMKMIKICNYKVVNNEGKLEEAVEEVLNIVEKELKN